MLVVADDARFRTRATAAAAVAGVGISAFLSVSEVLSRLAAGPSPDCFLLSVDGSAKPDAATTLERLLDTLHQGAGHIPGIIATGPNLIDLVAARALHPRIEHIVDPNDFDLAVAIDLVARPGRGSVRESSGSGQAAQLRALTDEVARISGALSRLAAEAPLPAPQPAASVREADGPMAGEVRRIIRARHLRGRFFDPELFADPAWDMLLDLMAAHIDAKPVAVSSLCIAAAVPATTALRWIRLLTDAGLFVRRADPTDGRRVFIELSESAADGMRGYLKAAGREASERLG